MVGVDLARCPTRTGPERHAAGFDALNGAVKHVVGNEQRIVLAGELDAGLGIIEPDPVVERQAEKWPPALGFRGVRAGPSGTSPIAACPWRRQPSG
ncbi:MAG: hypothetical protein ACRDQH_14720 [Pseudonocardiaceae bacterium]